jgi:hypothetical protein
MWKLTFPNSKQCSLFAARMSLEGIDWYQDERNNLVLWVDSPWEDLLPWIESFYPKETCLYEVL